MVRRLSIADCEKVDTRVCYGQPYGNRKVIMRENMYFYVLLAIGLFWIQSTSADSDFFPGLRRPPPIWSNYMSMNSEMQPYLAHLSRLIEIQARQRFQKQLEEHQLELQKQRTSQMDSQSKNDLTTPEFTYKFPVDADPKPDEPIAFAINPADPRYYETQQPKSDDDNSLSGYDDEYSYHEKSEERLNNDDVSNSGYDVPSLKLKAPMDVNPKEISEQNTYDNSQPKDMMSREDLKKLVDELRKNSQEGIIINPVAKGQDTVPTNDEMAKHIKNDVIMKQMEMEATTGMYVVAIIAGVSAAVSVGLIALGIGWYTLHKKSKAAADVEYPAYGVTGPNKESSPSGDRRLAQSAQMYHYQHQKQQIIAMENRAGDRKGSLTDVESDDDNEEGDYTVYECPGLAPTGEMEVKNPLFLDDPTPATPATSGATSSGVQPTQPTQKQPPQKSVPPTKKPSSTPPKKGQSKNKPKK